MTVRNASFSRPLSPFLSAPMHGETRPRTRDFVYDMSRDEQTRLDRAVERAASALVKALTASGADAAPLLATANETTMKAIAAADGNVIVDGEVFIRGEVAYAIMKRVVETGSQ
jgi:hypothetical protein